MGGPRLILLILVFPCKLHGAAYGKGIYLSPISSISFGYSGKTYSLAILTLFILHPVCEYMICAVSPPPSWILGLCPLSPQSWIWSVFLNFILLEIWILHKVRPFISPSLR